MTRQDDLVNEAVHEGRNTKARWTIVGLGVIAALLAVVAAVAFWYAYSNTRDQAEAGTSLAQQVRDACSNPEKASKDLSPLCDNADSVVKSGETVGIKGDKGDPGDPGLPGEQGPPPSDAQVSQAVALYCAGGRCDGSDGRNATTDQVAEAVALYCNSQGECRGPEGRAGPEGQDGATGNPGATGPQGPPPSDAQVQAAVSTYCSNHGNCQGPVGPAGQDGQDGQPGDTVDGGSCQFSGIGTITINIQTSNGPTTFECTGNPGNGGATQ